MIDQFDWLIFFLWISRSLKDKDVFSKSDPMCRLEMKSMGQDIFHEVKTLSHVEYLTCNLIWHNLMTSIALLL